MRRLLLLAAATSLFLSVVPALPAAVLATTCYGETATMVGDAGDNVLMGTAGDDVIQGNGGNDTIDGLGGNDLLCGGGGTDIIRGGPGHDTIFGGSGPDSLWGQGGRDAIAGLTGNDILVGGHARDVIMGNKGNDKMWGKSGGDYIEGNLGANDGANGGIHQDWCFAEHRTSCEGPAGPWRLRSTGIGNINFGTPTDFALVEFALLGDPMLEGDPDEDSGWISAFNSPYGVCPNDQVRMVRWGNLRTFFTRSGLTEGTFFTWQVVGFGGYEDNRLATANGLRLGDTRGQLELLYKVLSVEFVDPFNFWHFYTQGNQSGITGTLSDGTFGATVTHLQGGIGCGE